MLEREETRRAVVTGASGFLGCAVAAALRDEGWDVRGIDRAPSPGVRVADLASGDGWAADLDGCDVVVHTAGVVRLAGADEEVWRGNVDATRRVLDAAAAARARVVHASSVAVYGYDIPEAGAREEDGVVPNGSPYTDSKIAAEHAVLAAHAAGRVRAVVLRLSEVTGPGSPQWTLMPVELLRAGRFSLPDAGRGRMSPLDVADAVAALVAAARDPTADGRVLNVAPASTISAADLFGGLAAVVDGARIRSVPAPVARAVGRGGHRLLRAAGRAGTVPGLSPYDIAVLLRRGGYRIDAAARWLGWTPAVSPQDGIARTAAWVRAGGSAAAPRR